MYGSPYQPQTLLRTSEDEESKEPSENQRIKKDMTLALIAVLVELQGIKDLIINPQNTVCNV